MTKEFTQPSKEETQKTCDEMNCPEGMKLNQAVAEKLGWKDLRLVHVKWQSRWQLSGVCPDRGIEIECPDWSGRIGDAWKLFEKLTDKNDSLMLGRGYSPAWQVIEDCGYGGLSTVQIGKTASLAIVGAFLKAVE